MCNSCGLCCRLVDKHPSYASLDRGDGVCRHLDESTNLCGIYTDRPLHCRVDDSYKVFFSNLMSLDEYHILNSKACEQLKAMK